MRETRRFKVLHRRIGAFRTTLRLPGQFPVIRMIAVTMGICPIPDFLSQICKRTELGDRVFDGGSDHVSNIGSRQILLARLKATRLACARTARSFADSDLLRFAARSLRTTGTATILAKLCAHLSKGSMPNVNGASPAVSAIPCCTVPARALNLYRRSMEFLCDQWSCVLWDGLSIPHAGALSAVHNTQGCGTSRGRIGRPSNRVTQPQLVISSFMTDQWATIRFEGGGDRRCMTVDH